MNSRIYSEGNGTPAMGRRYRVAALWIATLLLCCLGNGMGALSEPLSEEWVRSLQLSTGEHPRFLLPGAEQLVVVNYGPSAVARRSLEEELLTRADSETGAAVGVLRGMADDIAEFATVLTYPISPDGRFWPSRETVLYEVREIERQAEEPERTEFGGALSAAVRIAKGNKDVVLVATESHVFEVFVSTGRFGVHEGGDLFPADIRSMACGDLTGDGSQELVVVSPRQITVYRVIRVAGPEGPEYQFERWTRWEVGRGQLEWNSTGGASEWVLIDDERQKGEAEKLGFDWDNVVIADLDRSGAGDIVVSNSARRVEVVAGTELTRVEEDIQIIWSERTGFVWPQRLTATVRPRSLAVGDVTGNGYPDIVVAGAATDDAELVLLEGAGDRRFSQPILVEAEFPNDDFALPPTKLAVVDLDGDGRGDLVATRPATGVISVYWGPFDKQAGPSRGFAAASEVSVMRPADLVVLDIDGDGKLDLVVLDQEEAQIAVFRHEWEREITRVPNPAIGHGAAFLAYGHGDGVGSTALAVPSPVLTHVASAGPTAGTDDYLEFREFERPGRDPDEVTEVSNISYTYYEESAPNVDVLVAQGGAVGGLPAAADEPPGRAFALSITREPTAAQRRTPATLLPRSGARGAFPASGLLDDFTGVGLQDLVVLFSDEGMKMALSPWHESPSLTPPVLPEGVIPSAAAAGDFDGDGILDLAVADRETGDLYVALGRLDGTDVSFSRPVRYTTPGRRPVAIAVAYLDEDGLFAEDASTARTAMLAVLNAGTNDVTVFWGRENGTFVRHAGTIPVGKLPREIAAGDFTGSGHVDLAVVNAGSDSVTIIESGEDRSVNVHTTVEGVGRGPVSVASGRSLGWLVGEEERAGHWDIAVACYASDEIRIVRYRPPQNEDDEGSFYSLPVADSITVFNLLATPLGDRDGHGPTSVVVGDFVGDGVDDLAFSVALPRGKLQVAQNIEYDAAVEELLRDRWQDVFIYYSGESNGVAVIRDPSRFEGRLTYMDAAFQYGQNVLAALQPAESLSDQSMTLLAMGEAGLGWHVLRQATLATGASRFAVADLNQNGFLDVIALNTLENSLVVFWGPGYTSAAAEPLAVSSAPVAVAAGASREGTWLLGGSVAWVSPDPGSDPWQRLMLDVAGGYPRSARAVSTGDVRAPPDLVMVAHRPELTTDEIRVFSGKDLLRGATTAGRTWIMPYRVSAFAAGDLDGDGLPDVVVAYRGEDTGQAWLGSGGRYELRGIGVDCVALAVGDVTGNGKADVLALRVSAGVARVSLYLGDGTGRLVRSSQELRVGERITDGGLTLADVNHNGKLDVIVYDRASGAVVVFHNGGHQDMERTMAGLRIVDRGFVPSFAGVR